MKAWVLKPLYNKDGSILLWDMYVLGKWVGSRRIKKQCREHLRQKWKSK